MWNNPRLLNAAAASLTLLALAVLAAGVLVWLLHRPMFALRTIRVEAESGRLHHVSVAAVRAATVSRVPGNFFTVDLEGVRHAFEGVPWVRHARVRREWPNRLVVKVEEQQPIGAWEDGRLVNDHGELFTANRAEVDNDADLPELSGPSGSEKDVLQRYRDFNAWFAKLGLECDAVTLSPRYAWSFHLDNDADDGLTVEVGREQDSSTIAMRVNRLIAAYPAVAAKWPKLMLIDLRYPTGFALRAQGLRIASESTGKTNATKSVPKAPVARKNT